MFSPERIRTVVLFVHRNGVHPLNSTCSLEQIDNSPTRLLMNLLLAVELSFDSLFFCFQSFKLLNCLVVVLLAIRCTPVEDVLRKAMWLSRSVSLLPLLLETFSHAFRYFPKSEQRISEHNGFQLYNIPVWKRFLHFSDELMLKSLKESLSSPLLFFGQVHADRYS